MAVLPARQRGRGVDLEAEHLGHVAALGLGRHEGRVDLEEDVLEGGAEVGAVDGGVAAGFRVVEIFAAAAVEFHRLHVGEIGHAGWEERLRFAEHAGAFAEVGFFVFFELGEHAGLVLYVAEKKFPCWETHHFGQATCGGDVASVDKAI